MILENVRGINHPRRAILASVMDMKFEDPHMEAYWNSLSPEAQAVINETGAEICSLEMLMRLGDYYENGNNRKWVTGEEVRYEH